MNIANSRTRSTIGLVDDHILLRRGIAMMLTEKGYTITLQADNGQRMIDMLNTNELPEVMIVDINMPLMDGYETTRWLRKQHPHVHVLAMSIIDRRESIDKMMNCGAAGYLLKDADPDALVRAIEEVRASNIDPIT